MQSWFTILISHFCCLFAVNIGKGFPLARRSVIDIEGMTGSGKSELFRRIKESGLYPNAIFPDDTAVYFYYVETPSGAKELMELRYKEPHKYAFQNQMHIILEMAKRETECGFDMRFPMFTKRSVDSVVKVLYLSF